MDKVERTIGYLERIAGENRIRPVEAEAVRHAIEIIKAAKRWADGKSRDDEVDALLQLRSLLSPEQYKEA